MGEKRGRTEKIRYDFDTAGVLEIFLNKKWYRVTSSDFRSFNGPRRITLPDYVEHGNVKVPLTTYEYDGPIYAWGTNYMVPYTNDGKIVPSEELNKRNKQSMLRQ